jgi:dipeptidyl aminopeptidase/acylaminoacyl peptidase
MFRHWNAWKEGRFSHLFVVPVDGAQPPRDLTPGAADVPPFSLGGPDDYAFSPDGKEIAFAKKTDPAEAVSTNSDLFLLDLSVPDAAPRAITTNKGADAGPAYSPDGRYIAYRAQTRPASESDRWRLMLYDRKTGEHREAAPAFDTWVDAYTWTPDSKALYLNAEQEGRSLAFRLDVPGTTPRALAITGSVSDVQPTPNGSLLFARSTAADPVELYLGNADGASAQVITHFNTAFIGTFKLRQAESVWYTGAAGARVQAWIVRPPDFREDRKYPLLFLVHGGPQGAWHDSWGYRWNPQVFAAAGYVVFMPNPRGSTGFGQKFLDEISGDWGGKVYDDLMKGADYAEALPYVERGKTGTAGGSFGGYMMDWFLGHTTRFKAIVTHSGVYNLTSMYGVTEELWFPEYELKGTPWSNPELYDRFSPHRYAKNFKTPTLVMHGELDFRVPVGEGLQLFTTLQRMGVPSKMLYFPDEGHWINKPANSALWYRTFIEWMDRWVKK